VNRGVNGATTAVARAAGVRDSMSESKPLTANSSIGAWLDHPVGGELVRGLLAQTGAEEEMLTPVKGLPLQQLVAMSQGRLPQSVVDDLVLRVNGGVAPVEEADTGWHERVTAGRFTGRSAIVTGAASGIGRATASPGRVGEWSRSTSPPNGSPSSPIRCRRATS
jgi:hypothetical protein